MGYLIYILVFFAACTSVFGPQKFDSDPFGFKFGEPLPEGLNCEPSPHNTYWCSDAPQDLDEIDAYVLGHDSHRKITKIVAKGMTYPEDPYGMRVRIEYDDWKRTLTEKYGKPVRDVDFLEDGSRLTRDRDFARGLDTGERQLKTVWLLGDVIVMLKGEASSDTRTFLILSYEHAAFGRKKQDRLKSF